jgi:putative membrane protein
MSENRPRIDVRGDRSMTRKSISAAAIAVLFLAGSIALANQNHDTTSSDRPSDRPLSKSAPSFARKAAGGGAMEVKLGTLAVSRATHPEVKTFARKMVDDHTKANDELRQLASQKGWVLPDTEAECQAKESKLAKYSGPEFDREYMQAMLKDHEDDVDMFRKYSLDGSDPELKAWALKTLPTLEEHEQLAKATANQVGVKISSMNSPNDSRQ